MSDTEMANSLKLVAAVLVVVGTLVLAFQSGALSSVTADRDVTGNVAADSEAYLAVEDVYAGRTVRNFIWIFPIDIPRNVVRVENRYEEDYTSITVRITSGPTDVLELRNVPNQLAVGSTATVQLGCTGDAAGSGTTDVTLEFDASGANIDIDDARVTIESVSYNCI